MLKIPLKYKQRYFVRPNSSFPLPVPLALLLDDFPVKITRDLWWTNKDFSQFISFHHGSPCSYYLGDEQQACWWKQFRDIV
jgi:hypothetical protein